MRARALTLICLFVLAAPNGACITDVCTISSGQVELKVLFSGFDLNAAHTLEVDSTVRGPGPGAGRPEYYDRRIDSMQFPESARSGSEAFILDPGAYINRFRDADERFTWTMVMRVYDDAGRLLAEGRHELNNAKTNGCYLARKLTVSAAQTCDQKAEGDPCVSTSANPWVCKDESGSLSCLESTCGDGFTDRRHGELCDPGAVIVGVHCHPTSCLPAPVEVVLTDGLTQWHQLTGGGPPARENAAVAKFELGGIEGVVLFGGYDGSGYLNDTWIFDGVSWEEPTVSGNIPTPRADHAMAWDPVAERVVMYGGRNSGGTRNETYLFDPAALQWSNQTPGVIGGPVSGLYSHAMAYDSQRGEMVLYGGTPVESNHPEASWWIYSVSANQWTIEDTGGEIRFDHTLTDVPVLGGLMLTGGQSGIAGVYDDAHFWDGTLRTESATKLGKTKLTAHQAVYSEATEQLVVYGGFDRALPGGLATGKLVRTTLSCALAADGVSCSDESAPDAPHGRRGHVMFEIDATIYLYGGTAAVTNGEGNEPEAIVGDTWQLTLPAAPKSAFALKPGLRGTLTDESLVTGLYDLMTADASSAPADRAGPMLIADLDGDGFEELALGLPGSKCPTLTGSGSCGRVIVKDHPIEDQAMGDVTKALATFIGEEDGNRRGSWVGTAIAAGDVNGDGAKDLVIGAPRAVDGGGGLYVVFGGDDHNLSFVPQSEGFVVQIGAPTDTDKYKAFTPPGPEDGGQPYHFGYSVAVGDFNGDGLADVVASAPSEGADATTFSSVYVLAGPGNSWSSGSGPGRVTDQATLTITTNTPGLQLGYSLTTGDLDGDGYTDLIIGTAPRPPFSTPVDTPRFGAVAVLFGGEGFFARPNPVVIVDQLEPAEGLLIAAPQADDPLAGLGGVLATADLDGDGADELAVSLGRPSRASGDPSAVALFPGSGFIAYRASPGTDQALRDESTVIVGPAGSGFGVTLTAGDANGDRNMDLLIGAPYQEGFADPGQVPRPETGAIYVVLGSKRADYFASGETSVSELQAVDVDVGDAVTIPLLIVRGNENFGFFGNSTATGSHIVATNPEFPAGYTLVYQPGWFVGTDAQERNLGRIWTLFLASLLSCESQAPCPIPEL